ncbi:GNAT family N-acetyltransferase [Mangrovitalea sediminis]|uniref:GNAT family N-acetyltransferase n=1 Tax=Mangrovitalea sediminis TaxID=1982043 RepID=UPI000BE4CD1D|nr:GNAT family N-acetyltransferase [Mangrovitalea sediminis]
MSDLTVLQENLGEKGRYVVRLDGIEEPAVLDYRWLRKDLMVAVHTGVPDAMQGRGVGRVLVERLIADARAGGYRIVPQCPYVRAQYERHPEWADVMAEAP